MEKREDYKPQMLKVTNLPANTKLEDLKKATRISVNMIQKEGSIYVFSSSFRVKTLITEAFPEAKQELVASDNTMYQ